jgi:hypothetical protein
LKEKIAEEKRIVEGKMLKKGWWKVCTENFNIGFRKQNWERTSSYIGLRKTKLKKSQRKHGTVHSASLELCMCSF